MINLIPKTRTGNTVSCISDIARCLVIESNGMSILITRYA